MNKKFGCDDDFGPRTAHPQPGDHRVYRVVTTTKQSESPLFEVILQVSVQLGNKSTEQLSHKANDLSVKKKSSKCENFSSGEAFSVTCNFFILLRKVFHLCINKCIVPVFACNCAITTGEYRGF